MEKPKCPECGSTNYIRERRPDGNTQCQDCDFKAPSVEWDKYNKQFAAFRSILEHQADKSYEETLSKQEGVSPKQFIDGLRKSDFFRGLYQEAFIAGAAFSVTAKDKITIVTE